MRYKFIGFIKKENKDVIDKYIINFSIVCEINKIIKMLYNDKFELETIGEILYSILLKFRNKDKQFNIYDKIIFELNDKQKNIFRRIIRQLSKTELGTNNIKYSYYCTFNRCTCNRIKYDEYMFKNNY